MYVPRTKRKKVTCWGDVPDYSLFISFEDYEVVYYGQGRFSSADRGRHDKAIEFRSEAIRLRPDECNR